MKVKLIFYCYFSILRNTLHRLRIGVIVTIVLQIVLQFIRTMRIFECKSYPDEGAGMALNIIILIAFLFAMWGLVVVFKSG